jgi:hypothetical protein
MSFDIVLRNPGAGTFNIKLSDDIPSPPSQILYSLFRTMILCDPNKTKWIFNSGQFNIASGMRASSTTPNKWDWFRLSSSSLYFYPSGITKWIWVSGNYKRP